MGKPVPQAKNKRSAEGNERNDKKDDKNRIQYGEQYKTNCSNNKINGQSYRRDDHGEKVVIPLFGVSVCSERIYIIHIADDHPDENKKDQNTFEDFEAVII